LIPVAVKLVDTAAALLITVQVTVELTLTAVAAGEMV
jgi:hypothetical protein